MTEPTVLQEKERHGCLTAYLVLAIIANSATALLYLFGAAAIKRSTPNIPDWAFPVLIVLVLFNLACAIALLRWKKWGFWGLIVCYRWPSWRSHPLRRSSNRKR